MPSWLLNFETNIAYFLGIPGCTTSHTSLGVQDIQYSTVLYTFNSRDCDALGEKLMKRKKYMVGYDDNLDLLELIAVSLSMDNI